MPTDAPAPGDDPAVTTAADDPRAAEVAEETAVLREIQAKLRAWDGGPRQADHGKALTGLRDSLEGEKLVDDIASIVEAMDRTSALMAQQAKADRGRVDPDNPYFGADGPRR